MECLLFSDLRIFSLSFPLCEWFSSTPFISLVYYIYILIYLYPKLPSVPSMSQESCNIETISTYLQDITDLKNKYDEKQWKYKNAYNKLLHASTGVNSVGVVSGVSTIGTAFTVVGLPISVSSGVLSTVSTCVGGILLLSSKTYKRKLLKCYDLLDKITLNLLPLRF